VKAVLTYESDVAMVNIRDVAEDAGVSRSTVFHGLSATRKNFCGDH
jgi:DNA-binding MurR/RpiR family transcriptional regulator